MLTVSTECKPLSCSGCWLVVGWWWWFYARRPVYQTRSNQIKRSEPEWCVKMCAYEQWSTHPRTLLCSIGAMVAFNHRKYKSTPTVCKAGGFFLLLFVEPNGKPITFDREKKKETKLFNGAYGVCVDVTSVRCSVRELLHVDSCTHTHSRIESDRVKSMSCRCRKNVYRPPLQLCRMWMSATTFYPPSSKLTRISTRGSRTEKEECYALPSRARKLEGIGRW